MRGRAGSGVLRRRLVRSSRRFLREDDSPRAVRHETAVKSRFPDPRYARGDVIALGDDLRVETLRDAYRHGIFPWPHEELTLPWFSPRRRTAIFFDELHVGRSLRKSQKRSRFAYWSARAFAQAIASCADTPRGDEAGTWIGPDIISAYTKLHRAGDAHSVEVWNEAGGPDGGFLRADAGGGLLRALL